MITSTSCTRAAALCTLAFGITLCLPQSGRAEEPKKNLNLQEELVKQANWRSIGPANMGGRVADVAVDPKNPYTFYVALATGGLIKTTNNGVTWTPIFEHESVGSVGAVAVVQTDGKTIWVGTGEANGRNSSSWGDGVYKSTDGGQTWKNMGLNETQEIARVVIDPNDANVVYVAATGHLWGPNKERGVYVTRDGGKTWEQSLRVDENTGAIDVTLGAPGSNTVYAAMYQRRRKPWSFEGAGPNAGIYKSTDAGKTWKKLINGLPNGPLGRIGLSVCASKPNTVYAVVEDQQGGGGGPFGSQSRYGGVFRSDDAGETWKRQSGMAPRGFYFSQIRVDPTNPDHVYVLGVGLAISDDGGKTFQTGTSRGTHPDEHAMWIDPKVPDHILMGTDGGIYSTYDRGKTWQHHNNFPEGEFYEVTTDNQVPFWVYGGLQDNDCWAGPVAKDSFRGPANSDWITIGPGGDGFYALADTVNTDLVYSESQNGGLSKWNRRTNQQADLHPAAGEGQAAYRFNWNTPLCLSRYDHSVLYMGGSHLFKYTGEGKEWNAISPDLSKQKGAAITTAGSGAETYGTIVTISESPLKKGLIWCGTDDGNVQFTENEGGSWTDVTHHLPGDVRDFWVTRVEASHFEPARAYVSIDGHRSDNFGPHLFATDDYGQSWRSITGNLPKVGPVQALREDPVNPDLLFVGTEFGAFVSFDRGGHWDKLGSGLPTVAVDDLAIQPRDHALVAATHGRSFYVLDNIAPLEELTSKTRDSKVHLFPIRPGHEWLPAPGGFGAGDGFQAQNPAQGVEIVYWLKDIADTNPAVTITDAQGKVAASLIGERFPGVKRVLWDMRVQQPGAFDPQFGGFGPRRPDRFVKPGVYTVTLTLGKEKQSQSVTVSGASDLSAAPDIPEGTAPPR